MTGKKSEAWIGVDFDGTLAKHVPGTYGSDKLGKPVKPMVDQVKSWLKSGKKVKIFTARADDEKSVTAITKWLQQHDLPNLPITNLKDKDMTAFYDDKAHRVEKNTGEIADSVVDKMLGRNHFRGHAS